MMCVVHTIITACVDVETNIPLLFDNIIIRLCFVLILFGYETNLLRGVKGTISFCHASTLF